MMASTGAMILRLIASLCLLARVEAKLDINHNLRGQPSERGLIIGGEEAIEGRFPYFAVMNRGTLCGSVLISPRFALTAGHCQDADRDFAFGSETRYGGKEVMVVDRAVHPLYNKFTFENDVAIFELAEDATFPNGTAVPYVTLDPREITSVTTEMTVVGFGDIDPVEDVTTFAEGLNRVDVTYVTNEECQRDHKYDEITKHMMCAEDLGKDACYGDSGGPLLLTPSEDYREDTLVGIVSWGRGCADEAFPGVYTRISHFYDWIVGTMCVLNSDSVPPYVDCAEIMGLVETDDVQLTTKPTTFLPTKNPTSAPSSSPTVMPTTSPTFDPPTAQPVAIPICGERGASCNSASDCCSDRCNFFTGTCFPSASSTRQRLSLGVGGSATSTLRARTVSQDIP